MRNSGSLPCLLLIAACAAGCSQKNPHDAHSSDTAPASAASAATSGPARPAVTADDTTWGNYLSAQGKLHSKDVPGHPYIYVIPTGDSPAAIARRAQESQSIAFSIGPIVIPGSILILGGPDAQQTNQFTLDLPKTIKAHALKNTVVLVVGDTTQKEALAKAFAPTDATLRFVTM